MNETSFFPLPPPAQVTCIDGVKQYIHTEDEDCPICLCRWLESVFDDLLASPEDEQEGDWLNIFGEDSDTN